MLSWLGKKMIARHMREASAGNIGPDAENTQQSKALDEYLAGIGK